MTVATTPPVRFPASQKAIPTLTAASTVVANISIQPLVIAVFRDWNSERSNQLEGQQRSGTAPKQYLMMVVNHIFILVYVRFAASEQNAL